MPRVPAVLRSLQFLAIACLCAAGALASVARAAIVPPEVTVLCYHEIAERKDALTPSYAVPPALLEKQLQWLKANGYHFVSVQDILDARAHKKPLPAKPVLMTFDDGYESVYKNAWPILKREKIPALVALVGHWLEVPEGKDFDFDGRPLPRNELMAWSELKKMQDSGLVEIASHSFDLHRGILANPQGNRQPAATALQWVPDQQRYETVEEYRARIRRDFARNNALISKRLGKAPRVMVWPYGRYNADVSKIGEQMGMPIGLNLDDGPNTASTPLSALRRELVMGDTTPEVLAHLLRVRERNVLDQGRAAKVAQIDLDYIYDKDPEQTEANLGRLLDRVQRLGINIVYLQAFADPDANGAADAVYFPNRHMPMRADLFNRVAWQLLTRTQVKRVFAWMPLLAWQPPASDPVSKDVVVTLPNKANHLAMGYPRLTPFSPRVRKWVKEIYEDLGRQATFDGILFHDDVTLSDYEDGSSWAKKQYRAWGLPQPLPTLRTDRALLLKWSERKTDFLDGFALDVAAAVRAEQPGLLTARNLYAQVALNPEAETWYSQNLRKSIQRYDYTAIMVMPYMEQAEDPQKFYKDMVAKVKAVPHGINHTVFELQSVDWRKDDAPLPPNELPDTIRMLYGMGVKHVGYYPDNVFNNVPDAALLKPVLDSKLNPQDDDEDDQ